MTYTLTITDAITIRSTCVTALNSIAARLFVIRNLILAATVQKQWGEI